ncbi:Protein CBG10974 [Caenorhabditis briggsae]|uniref:Protein pop-1 n=2 Tax=Caenorhabditis briggsae TaxID=6238 RepID=A8XBZ0_CAEBR|nr:Protein CBG10974 [Caenorhabditis briggsae]CAP30229.2 Protein CBG10974 [Caenorhabditis briggsae]
MDSMKNPTSNRVGFLETSLPQPQILPPLPLNLLPGMLPITQYNPFYNFPRMAPMITPSFSLVPPTFNIQMNLMNPMAMQAMTPRTQLDANSLTGFHTNAPMVPFPEAMKAKSSFLIDTILSAGQKNPINQNHKKENHIKKPLNAFMLFLKENRKTLIEENGYDEMSSGLMNKELGRRWQKLTDDEKQPYFELAKIEKERHKEKYPEWSAKDNLKKSKKYNPAQKVGKMCRAQLGNKDRSKWCKYCLRKQKCILSRILSQIAQTHDEETASEISHDNPESSSSIETTPIDSFPNQVSITLQEQEENLDNSEVEEGGPKS